MSSSLSIDQWWPRLPERTRTWLIDNNGDVVPANIRQEIEGAGGAPAGDEWWFGGWEPSGSGLLFSDAGVDWIEAAANGEAPDLHGEPG